MSTHELASRLLELPDLPVQGQQTGQGSGEGQDEPLDRVEVKNGITYLIFS